MSELLGYAIPNHPSVPLEDFRSVGWLRDLHGVPSDLSRQLQSIVFDAGAAICGGAARYVVSPRESPVLPEDVDIYPNNPEQFDAIYIALTDDMGMHHKEDADLFVQLEHRYMTVDVQIIKPKLYNCKHATDPRQHLQRFVSTVCMAALISPTAAWVGPEFDKDETAMEINFNCLTDAFGAMFHLFKYSKKGYTIGRKQVMEVFEHWRLMPSNERERQWGFVKEITQKGSA